jgi:kynurenine formamidase
VDVSEKALPNRDYLISVADLENWEKTNGTIPENCIVLFKTGYGAFYPDRLRYFGTIKKGAEAIPELHFPGIDPETTKWLIEKRNIKKAEKI